jgi:hypothetical protein
MLTSELIGQALAISGLVLNISAIARTLSSVHDERWEIDRMKKWESASVIESSSKGITIKPHPERENARNWHYQEVRTLNRLVRERMFEAQAGLVLTILGVMLAGIDLGGALVITVIMSMTLALTIYAVRIQKANYDALVMLGYAEKPG